MTNCVFCGEEERQWHRAMEAAAVQSAQNGLGMMIGRTPSGKPSSYACQQLSPRPEHHGVRPAALMSMHPTACASSLAPSAVTRTQPTAADTRPSDDLLCEQKLAP